MKRIIVLCAILLLLLPFAVLAQDICEGNFDCDMDVDGSDASVFKSDFGRSALSNPCHVSDPCYLCSEINPVPKTGQTISYVVGDDGDLEKGVAWPIPRFTDNSDGTVTDNLTGLIWLKNANCAAGELSWYDASVLCHYLSSGQCGLSDGSSAGDWRLPNKRELFSLTDDSHYNPALPSGHPFTNVQSSSYWSSTTYASSSGGAWYVSMGDGHVGDDNKYSDVNVYVWPVRGGQ